MTPAERLDLLRLMGWHRKVLERHGIDNPGDDRELEDVIKRIRRSAKAYRELRHDLLADSVGGAE